MKWQFKKNDVAVINIPVVLAKIAGAGDVVTGLPLDFDGYVEKVEFVVTDAVTTGSKAVTLNLEIGTTNITGGVLALTSANCTPLGKVIEGTAITANNGFNNGSTLSVEASSVTAFSEGQGVLVITLKKEK